MSTRAVIVPRGRGVIHSWLFLVAVPAGLALVLMANGRTAQVAAAIYMVTVAAGFGVSAAYHRLAHSVRARMLMQRLDHSTIYLLILGTYVPICLIALPARWGVPLLAVVAVGAAVGVVHKLVAFGRLRVLGYSLYPLLGWAAVIATPVLITHLSPVELALIVAGGVAYTAGIPFLVLRRPDPWPRWFGYHEIWHSFTGVAAVLHFVQSCAPCG